MTSDNTPVLLLDDPDPGTRRQALQSLLASQSAALPDPGMLHNMHAHSFFSFNASGWSPTRIVWEARRAGLYAAGLCDFDVLDGLEEFYDAGLLAGLRVTVNLETRAFLRDRAGADINSPGEPGVAYIMGAGFPRKPAGGAMAVAGLAGYRRRARERNEALVARINRHVPPIALDYARDVLPLTPAGAATERHIVRAYVHKARAAFSGPDELVRFWSGALGAAVESVAAQLPDEAAFEEAVRARFVKRGGLGYEAPSPDTFPPVEEFIVWTRVCGAVPMAAWLDGTSDGERDPEALLDGYAAKGVAALNVIPDRNWNVRDPAQRARKVAALNAIVAAAERRNMPVNIGTELNKEGLPFCDDLEVEALQPHSRTFLRGARIMVGHCLLARYADFGYAGHDARREYTDIGRRNDVFERVGAAPPLAPEEARRLEEIGPQKARAWLLDRGRCAHV